MRYLVVLFVFGLLDISTGLLPPQYDGLSAEEKQGLLWGQISRDPYPADSLPISNPGIFGLLKLFFPPFLKKSFTHISDEMPNTRQKVIHTYGSVAKMEFRPLTNNSDFTGIFRTGAIGFVRCSLAQQSDTNYIPGLAVKFLIDGSPSLNLHVMNSLDGQGSNKNYFERQFHNIVPEPQSFSLKILSKAFALALWCLPGGSQDKPESETNLPLYEHAAVDSKGQSESAVYAPYELTFTPNPQLGWAPDTNEDLRVHLGRIPVNTVLYTVSAQRGLRTEPEDIGEIVTASPFVSSRYGDETLFFQHARQRWRP